MGGIEKTLLACVKYMNRDEFEMTICCYKKAGVLLEDFINNGVKIIRIKKTGLIIFDFLQIFYVLLRGNFDILHSRFGFTSGGFVLAAKLLKKSVFVSIHSTNPSALENFRSKKMLYKVLRAHLQIHKSITLKYATKIIGHSKANLDNYFKNWQNSNRFQLIYNGVDFSKISSNGTTDEILDNFTNNRDFTLLHIGSFRKEKNHKLLLRGFQRILAKSDQYKLILVGEGTLKNEMEILARKLKIEKNVFFAGFDESIKKYFEAADLFVMPSFIEGFGNVLIESQYSSVPICVSNIPALQESGYKAFHPYYFNPNDEEDFVEKLSMIIKVLKDRDLDATILDAKIFASDFSIQSMNRRLENMYRLANN